MEFPMIKKLENLKTQDKIPPRMIHWANKQVREPHHKRASYQKDHRIYLNIWLQIVPFKNQWRKYTIIF